MIRNATSGFNANPQTANIKFVSGSQASAPFVSSHYKFMNPETKTCQNCKKEFQIEPEDFEFYLPSQVLQSKIWEGERKNHE